MRERTPEWLLFHGRTTLRHDCYVDLRPTNSDGEYPSEGTSLRWYSPDILQL